MLAKRPKPTTVFAVSLIILFMSIGASAMLDWQIMSHSGYDLSDLVEYTQYINYASWFAVNISMPGIAMSVVTCAFYWNSKRIRIMLPVAILVCTAILLISGLEDCMYFFLEPEDFLRQI